MSKSTFHNRLIYPRTIILLRTGAVFPKFFSTSVQFITMAHTCQLHFKRDVFHMQSKPIFVSSDLNFRVVLNWELTSCESFCPNGIVRFRASQNVSGWLIYLYRYPRCSACNVSLKLLGEKTSVGPADGSASHCWLIPPSCCFVAASKAILSIFRHRSVLCRKGNHGRSVQPFSGALMV